MSFQIYESGNYLIIDTYDDVARVVTASSQYAKKNSYYNKTEDGYVITEFGGGEFPILDADIAANIWTDNAAVPLSESEIVDILQNHTGNFKSAAGGSVAVGAVLMKTGQLTSFRTGDDGAFQAGRAVDFFTLENANPFGNYQRFSGTTGGYYDQTLSGYYDKDGIGTTYALAFPEDILIDWSTYDNITGKVLGYYITKGSTATWNDAIDNSLAHTTTSFATGWRLWNMREADNLRNFDKNRVLEYAPFSDATNADYWTSNTLPSSTTNAYRRKNQIIGFTNYSAKTSSFYYKPVRTFTVSGTTLS